MTVDALHRSRTKLRWSRIDLDRPGGLHEPKRPGDIGWDLEAMEDITIPPMQVVDVPINARIELPPGYWAEIRARSSFATRNMQVEAGTIDTGYRGQLFVLIRNLHLPVGPAPSPFVALASYQRMLDESFAFIKRGERVGQLVFHHTTPLWAAEVEAIDLNTERSENGFGSTGR